MDTSFKLIATIVLIVVVATHPIWSILAFGGVYLAGRVLKEVGSVGTVVKPSRK